MTEDGRKITCVEFFDETPADNMCVALTNTVDTLVLLGSSTKEMERAIANYKKVISVRGIIVNFTLKSVPRNDINALVNALTEIAMASDICLFDLTGGEDLPLVAAGIVYERLKGIKEIQMHRFNISGGTRDKIIVNCDDNPETYFDTENPPELSVTDNIELAGGEVVVCDNDFTFTLDDIDEQSTREINTLWNLYKQYNRVWNNLGARLAQQVDKKAIPEEREIEVLCKARPETNIINDYTALAKFAGFMHVDQDLILSLISKSLITYIAYLDGDYCIDYKDRLVKECLTTAGKLLELKVFERCAAACDNDDRYVYNSVRTGVKIDWSGMDSDLDSTINEIDVIAMHGMVPVYISCKNGHFTAEEMYKISSVAQAFGKKYARKVIIATATDNVQSMDALRERAKDMGIKLIEDFSEMDDDEMADCVAAFWKK